VAQERGSYNFNAPTVIEVPVWVQNPLGRYYLYFAHHKGSYIRLAYSDSPLGPWTVHQQQVLPLAQSGLPSSLAQVTNRGNWKTILDTFELPVIRDFLIMLWSSKVNGRNTQGNPYRQS